MAASSSFEASSTRCGAPSKCSTPWWSATREFALDKRIEFRIGIHLGDVVEESDGDLMGAGVNIAARLEGVCDPGAVCLSEDAYRQVKGRLDLAVTDLGQTQLKNIADPIRVYSLQVGVPAVAKPAAPAGPVAPKGAPRWLGSPPGSLHSSSSRAGHGGSSKRTGRRP